MAGRDKMTIEEVVRRVLRDEDADVIRESLRAVRAVSSCWQARTSTRRPTRLGSSD